MDMLLLLMTIDKEECQTVNTQKRQKDDNYHKISHTTHIAHYKFTTVSQSAEDRTLGKHQ